jgi:flagellar basal body-associated protein FliL
MKVLLLILIVLLILFLIVIFILILIFFRDAPQHCIAAQVCPSKKIDDPLATGYCLLER